MLIKPHSITTRIVFIFLIILISNFSYGQKIESPDKSIDHVRLQLKWKHQFQFAGYYAAIEKGFYEENGIETSLIEAIPNEEPAISVFNGSAEFGISTSDIVLMKKSGYNPVIIASIFQHSPQILITSAKSGINNIHLLKGKTIALEPHAADIITYMADEGVKLSDCIITDHHFTVDQLIAGEVDAITAYNTDEPFILEQNGFEYYEISPLMGGIDFYGDLLFCSDSLLINNESLVKRFREASLKGWNYALDNQEEIIQLIFDKYSQRHTIDHLRFEAKKTAGLILPNIIEIGYSNPGRWDRIINIYEKLNFVDSNENYKDLFYSDYINKDQSIPWKLVLIIAAIALFLLSIIGFFGYLLRKQKTQIEIIERTRKSLFNSEAMLNSLIDNMPAMVYRCECDKDWTMRYLSKRCKILTGYDTEDLLNNKSISYNDIIHKDDRDLVKNSVELGIENNSLYEITYRIITREGKEKWVREKGSAILTNTNEIKYLEGIIFDINERKEAEDKIIEYQESLEKLLNEKTESLKNKDEELEKFNKLFVSREFRIKELRDKIKDLEKIK